MYFFGAMQQQQGDMKASEQNVFTVYLSKMKGCNKCTMKYTASIVKMCKEEPWSI